jgi:hypothetical protein
MMSKLIGSTRSKTMLFSLLLVIAGAVEASMGLLQSIIPPQYYGLSVMGIGIVVAVLRWITTTGLGDK